MANKTHFPTAGANRNAALLGQYMEGRATGNLFFVQSTTGNDTTGSGYSPENPLATINAAVAKCAANNGDVIYLMPGHVETIIAAAGVLLNKAGVTVRGMGEGRIRPRVNYTTAAAASFDITAANCTVENLWFTPTGFAAVTAAINLQAADCTIRGCEFDHGNATNEAALVILGTAAADRFIIEDNYFHGTTDAGTNAAISLVGGNDGIIRRNRILGSYHATAGVILSSTTDCLNLTIEGNVIVNRTASSTKVIVLTASTTGVVVNNRFGILSGTAPITGAALDARGGNYYSAAAGVAAGVLL